uniref:von Willebrand factor A domain-containing protein 5A-like n=1 Tax=Monopterus albus TaxID=43700 RepID=UPI0009B48176
PQGSEGAGVQVTSVPASLVPYSLSFSARVSSSRPISKVESSSSLDPLQYLNTEQTQATMKLAAVHKFDRDVELLIYYKDAHQPTAVVEAGQASAKPGTLMGDPVVMLSLYPEFPQAVMSSVASCGEFVFLLDRSASMDYRTNNSKPQETRIGSARDTLLLLLKSLPMGCYFNIYSFGSSYEHIFPKSVEYSQTSMEEALKKVEEMQANLGGTEILRPLDHIYSQPCVPGHPRQVSLQKASGSWMLDPALAAALGKTSEEVEKPKPASVNKEVWATILALLWLHGFKMDAKEEWELLAMKATSWLCAQNAPCVTECVEAGNSLLGCKVQKDALGL